MSTKSTELVIAKFDYKAADNHELGIQKGDRLTLLDDSQHWWRVMNAKGETVNNGAGPKHHGSAESFDDRFSQLHLTSAQVGAGVVGGDRGDEQRYTSTQRPGTDAFHSYTMPPSDYPTASSGLNRAVIHNPGSDGTKDAGYRIPQPGADGFNTTPAGGAGGMASLGRTQSAVQAFPMSTGVKYRQNGHTEPTTDSSNGLQSAGHLQPPPQQHQHPHQQSLDNNPHFGTGTGGGRHICQALFAYVASQPDELSIERGDRIHVLERSSDGWWRGVLLTETATRTPPMGWFPSNYVTLDTSKHLNRSGSSSQPGSLNKPASTRPINDSRPLGSQTFDPQVIQPQPRFQSNNPLPFGSMNTSSNTTSATPTAPVRDTTGSPNQPMIPLIETVLTLYPFSRNQVEEMSFEANELLQILDKPVDDPDWLRCRNTKGEVGLVPRNYVQIVQQQPIPHTVETGSTTPRTMDYCVPPATTAPATTTSMRERLRDTYSSGRPTAPPVNVAPPNAAAGLDRLQGNGGGGGGGGSGSETDPEALRLTYAVRSPTARAHVKQPWCWGSISRAECEHMLNRFARPGEFIIRDSESHPGDLTVTINAGSKTRNFKVRVEHDQYHIGQKVFSSIDNLIEHYRTHPIFKNEQERHYLTRPFRYPSHAMGSVDPHEFSHAPTTPLSLSVTCTTNSNTTNTTSMVSGFSANRPMEVASRYA